MSHAPTRCIGAVAIFISAIWGSSALAQGRGARVVSPEILPDHKVTFRIQAPKATEVILHGDWTAGEKLTKDEQGLWSVTVGPLVPDYYSYTFSVDGVKTLDPVNGTIKQGLGTLDNMFFVKGEESAFEDNAAVPHGQIRQVWYVSKTLEKQRRMHVYTPPGYEGGLLRQQILQKSVIRRVASGASVADLRAAVEIDRAGESA